MKQIMFLLKQLFCRHEFQEVPLMGLQALTTRAFSCTRCGKSVFLNLAQGVLKGVDPKTHERWNKCTR